MKASEEIVPIKLLIAYWEKLNHLQIYQLLNMAEICSPLQSRNSSNTSKNITRMLGIENVVSLLIKLNSTCEHPHIPRLTDKVLLLWGSSSRDQEPF